MAGSFHMAEERAPSHDQERKGSVRSYVLDRVKPHRQQGARMFPDLSEVVGLKLPAFLSSRYCPEKWRVSPAEFPKEQV